MSDEKILTYWKFEQPGGLTTSELLAHQEGDGNCNGWSQFFRDVLRVQGIEANMVKVLPILLETPPYLTAEINMRLAVKEWTFIDEGTASGDYPYVAYVDAIPGNAGTPAQNNDNPPKIFNIHYVTLSGGIIYDSSYGTDPVGTTVKAYEDSTFAGYGKFTMHNGSNKSLLVKNNEYVLSWAEVEILEVINE